MIKGLLQTLFISSLFALFFSAPFISAESPTFVVNEMGYGRSVNIKSHQTALFLYHSSDEGDGIPLGLYINWIIEAKSKDEALSLAGNAFRKDGKIEVKYWPSDRDPDSGKSEDLRKLSLLEPISQEEGPYVFRQYFKTEEGIKIGKYSFEMKNPFDFDTWISIETRIPTVETKTLGSNDEDRICVLDEGGRIYEIPMKGGTQWYFSMIAGPEAVDLQIADGKEDFKSSPIITIERGKDYFHQEAIKSEGVKYVRIRQNPKANFQTTAILGSNIFDQKEALNFDLVDTKLQHSASIIYEPTGSTVNLKIKPIKLKQADPAGQVLYQARICPEKPEWSYAKYDCTGSSLIDSCQISDIFETNSQGELVTSFESIQENTYFIQAAAVILHKNLGIRMLNYPEITLSVPETALSSSFGIIITIVGIIMLLITVLLFTKCYKRFKSSKQHTELELQSSLQKSYNSLMNSE